MSAGNGTAITMAKPWKPELASGSCRISIATESASRGKAQSWSFNVDRYSGSVFYFFIILRKFILSMTNFIEELKWRGMIHSMMPGTEEQMLKEMTTAYVGIDPTAD